MVRNRIHISFWIRSEYLPTGELRECVTLTVEWGLLLQCRHERMRTGSLNPYAGLGITRPKPYGTKNTALWNGR